MEEDKIFMRDAISQSLAGIQNNEGGPFGAIVVKDGIVVGRGNNQVTSTNDPTAHAEIMAIRDACRNLHSFQLDDCVIYTSCEPCPMCLGAIYWARPRQVFYGCTREDAAKIGFDDDVIYKEMAIPIDHRIIPMQQLLQEEAITVFEAWQEKVDRVAY